MKRTVYLILFRGVGGKTQLPVAALREKLTAAGFENVATYINSGNAIVRSRLNREKVIAKIAELCRVEFGFDKAREGECQEDNNRSEMGKRFLTAETHRSHRGSQRVARRKG